jgi:hypothetical protein
MQLLKAPIVIWLKLKDIIIEEVSWLGRFCVILHAISLKGIFRDSSKTEFYLAFFGGWFLF